MKKIYFACSIRGGREDAAIYEKLVAIIGEQADVLSEIFADRKLTSAGMNLPASDIWKKDIGWIEEADAVIAEVTNPSLGVGYEIAKAEAMKKPILCLYRPDGERKLSAMIKGSPNLTLIEYQKLESATDAIQKFIVNI